MKLQRSRTYECMCLLDNREVRKGWEPVKESVSAVLTKHGAKVVSSRRWDERRLGYPVRGQSRGTYLLVYFESDTQTLTAIRRDLNFNEAVMRYLTLSCDEVPETAPAARLASRRLSRNGLPMRLCRAKAQRLPFPDNYFANVIATFPTNYIFEPDTVAEIYRVLSTNPTGRLIIVIEGQLRGPWPIRPFIDWLYRISDQRDFPPRHTFPIFAEYDLDARWQMVDHNGAAARMLIADKAPKVDNLT